MHGSPWYVASCPPIRHNLSSSSLHFLVLSQFHFPQISALRSEFYNNVLTFILRTDTPWTFYMSDDHEHDTHGGGTSNGSDYNNIHASDPNPPTIASFAPLSSSPASRSRFQVHQKSPLLVATPPQITRALSQSYPYLKAANRIAGLLTWTSKDPWESFLVVAVFWATALYGDVVLRWAGNVFIVVLLILGMFLRRYNDGSSPCPGVSLSTF